MESSQETYDRLYLKNSVSRRCRCGDKIETCRSGYCSDIYKTEQSNGIVRCTGCNEILFGSVLMSGTPSRCGKCHQYPYDPCPNDDELRVEILAHRTQEGLRRLYQPKICCFNVKFSEEVLVFSLQQEIKEYTDIPCSNQLLFDPYTEVPEPFYDTNLMKPILKTRYIIEQRDVFIPGEDNFEQQKTIKVLQLNLAVLDNDQLEAPVRNISKMKNLSIWKRLTVKAFGSHKVLPVFMCQNFNKARLNHLIHEKWKIPISEQILIAMGKEVKPSDVFSDNVVIYLAVTDRFKDNLFTLRLGIKKFDVFTLKFLTREEDLSTHQFKFVKDVKRYIHQKYKIRPDDQTLVFRNRQLKVDQPLFDLHIEENSMKPIALNVIVVEESFILKVFQNMIAYEDTFTVLVKNSYTISTIKRCIEARTGVPFKYRQLYIGTTVLDDDEKTLQDYMFTLEWPYLKNFLFDTEWPDLVLKQKLMIRLHFVDADEKVEYSEIIDKNCPKTVKDLTKEILQLHSLKKCQLLEIRDENEVKIDLKTRDLLVTVNELSLFINKDAACTCRLM
eukprot:TCONS_00027660-protein